MNPSVIGILDEPAPEATDVAEVPIVETEGVHTDEEAQVDPPVEPTEPAAATPAVAATVEPFEFGGKTYTSRADAEQDFKSWEGRITAEQEKVKDYEKRLNQYWEYVNAVDADNKKLREAHSALVEDPKAKKDADPKIDFDQIGRLMQIARQQGVDPLSVGIRAYAAQAETVQEAKLEARLARLEKPLNEMQEATAEQTADRQMFLWAQSLKAEDGNPAFPELQVGTLNEGLVTNIHRVWKQMHKEFGSKYAYSAPGFDYAYRLAKDMMPEAPVTPAVVRDAQGRFLPNRDSAVAASGITGNNPNPVKPRASKTKTQEMLEEMAAIKPVKMGETDLGFYE